MQTCLSYISQSQRQKHVGELWNSDPCKAFHNLELSERAYFLLGQTIFMHYIDRLMSAECHPFYSEYKQYLMTLVVESLSLVRKPSVVGIDKDVQSTLMICNALLSPVTRSGDKLIPVEIDRTHITHVLYDSEFSFEIPQPCDPSFAIPFIMWINATSAMWNFPTFDENDALYASSCYFPHFSIIDNRVHVDSPNSNYPMGNSFQLDKGILTSPNFRSIPILQFIAMMELSGREVETIFARIGSMCPHLDLSMVYTNTHRISYRLYCSMFKYEPISIIRFGNLGNWGDDDLFITCMLEFIAVLNEKYNVVVPDKEALVQILTNPEWKHCELKKDKSKLIDYLKCEDIKSVSTEMYHAFQSSLIHDISEYDVFSQKVSVVAKDDQGGDLDNTNDPMPTDEGDDDGDSSEPDGDPKDDPMPEDNSSDDTPDEEDQDDTLGNEEDDMPTDDSEGSGEESGDDTQDDTQTSENPPLNTSDPRGIVIKITKSDDETTDSILFKEEMNNYLSTLLKNPPAKMSPQHVQLLTKLWKNWLYALDVQTITKIVAIATKLPVVMKRINTNGDSPQ